MPRASRTLKSPEAPRFEDDVVDAVPGPEGLEQARVVDADLAGAKLKGLRLIDVAIERGNFANLVAPEPTLRRVTVSGARLTGVQWTRGSISDVVFRDCRIDLATFAGSSFERVTFEGCMLAQVEFREALLRSVRFEHCDLTEADLTGLRIDGCELRSCTLDGLAGAERLRGAAMPWGDIIGHAGLFATALGVRVLDEDAPS